jgi:glyoxylase I family protein
MTGTTVTKTTVIKTRDIDHVVIRVIDVEKMEQFYCEVLGLSVAKRNRDLDIVHLRTGRSMIDLVPVTGKAGARGGDAPAPNARNMDHLCLRVEPYDEAAILAHLSAHHVKLGETVARFGAEGNGRSIYLYDPEGNTVELKGPSDGVLVV